MKKIFSFGFINILIAFLFQTLHAQNTSPFWSLSGNNNASASSKLGTTNNIPLRFFTKNKERLRIDSSGNIGIGIKSPLYKLHVEGGSSLAAIYGHSTKGYGVYGIGNIYGLYGYGFNGVLGYSDSTGYGVYGVSSSVFSVNGSAGVYGEAYYGVEGVGKVGVKGMGTAMGVYGYATDNSGFGVYGVSPNYGVYAVSDYIGLYAVGDKDAFAGFFDGNVYSNGNYLGSDSKLKKSITDFSSAMDIINKLHPKLYEFRQDSNYKLMHLPEGKHYGLIAQDLEQILPGLVKQTKFETSLAQPIKPGTSAKEQTAIREQSEVINFKAVNYTELIPIMVKAMQEQQIQIQNQQTQIEELENEISGLKQSDGHTVANAGILSQAIPNPTNGIAHISYRLPKGTAYAQLLITDMSGKEIKIISLNNSGNVDINTTSLSSGVYNYSLQVNGRVISAKKLMVAH